MLLRHRDWLGRGGVVLALAVTLLVSPTGGTSALPLDNNNWPRLPTDGEIAAAAAAFQPAKPPATADHFLTSKWHDAANPVLAGLEVALTFDLHYRGQVNSSGPFRDLTDACLAWLTFNTDTRVFRFALAYCGDQAERTSRFAVFTAGWPASVNPVSSVAIRPGEEPIGLVREVVGTGRVDVALLDPSAPGDAGDLTGANWQPLPWDGKTRLPLGDRVVIRTGPDTEVVILFATGALTRIKPNSTLLIRRFETAQTSQGEMYMRLYQGIANFYGEKAKEDKKKFEVDVNRVIVGIKGTQVTFEARDDGSAVVTVDEGDVEVTDKATGTVYPLGAGQRLTADGQQLVIAPAVDAAAPTPTAAIPPAEATATPPPVVATVPPGPSRLLFYNGNDGGVQNGPPNPTVFTLTTSQAITRVITYHWNSGRGTPTAGTIALRDAGGRVYGPWPATGRSGQGNVPNAYWDVMPNIVLTTGSYTIVDSDPGTWAYNAQTGGAGIAWVEGGAAFAPAAPGPDPMTFDPSALAALAAALGDREAAHGWLH